MTTPDFGEVELILDASNRSENLANILTELHDINWLLTVASDPLLAHMEELRRVYLAIGKDAYSLRASREDPEHYSQVGQRLDKVSDELRSICSRLETLDIDSSDLIPASDKPLASRIVSDARSVLDALTANNEEAFVELLYGAEGSASGRINALLNAAEEHTALRVKSVRLGSIILTLIASSGASLTALTALVTGRSIIRKNTADATKSSAEAVKAVAETAKIMAEGEKIRAEAIRVQVETQGLGVDNLERLIELMRRSPQSDMGGGYEARAKIFEEFLVLQFPHMRELPHALDHIVDSLMYASDTLKNAAAPLDSDPASQE